MKQLFALSTFAIILAANVCTAGDTIKALLVDGQNNHKWEQTSPLIKATLESTDMFSVDVATAPGKGGDMSTFKPKFSDYDVVVSNYNGDPWSKPTQEAFTKYVRSGGGFVSVHAADNSFPKWSEYNEMIGVGGWGGRTEKNGPYVRWRDGKFERDTQAGRGGSHGKRHPFEVVVRNTEHPITRGLPASWLQAEDELYAELRGPAVNMKVLATAFSSKAVSGPNGTDQHEPILMVVDFGKGRAFHTTLGHDTKSMSGTAFQVTLQRGTEWAATGNVTQPSVTAALLSKSEPIMRDPLKLEKPTGHDKADFSTAPSLDVEGWAKIFNSKDLSGWSQKNGTATYAVEDSVVVGRTAVGSPNSFMCTEKNYADFELTFEVKVDVGLNSGVQIRSKSLSDYKDGRVHGPQVEIETGPAEAGYVYGEATGRGWLSPRQPKTDAMNNDDWNRFVIRAVGPRIQTWINGQMIEDIYDATSYQEGFIGLQVHGIGKNKGPYEVRWRDIKIREIK